MIERRFDEGGVRLALAGAVATITLARADSLNAQTPHTWSALREIGRTLPADIRIVVVRAEGSAFSAGLDRRLFTPEGVPGVRGMPELVGLPTDEADRLIESYQQGFNWLRRTDLISIAAVQGHAVGAGFQLALACDFRVLAENALLCMAETGLGLVPDLGGTQSLVALIGPSRALEICLTGRRVSAIEALQTGLANIVVPLTELDVAVAELVAALLAPPGAAMSDTKALVAGASMRSPADQEAAERSAQLRRIRDLTGAAGI